MIADALPLYLADVKTVRPPSHTPKSGTVFAGVGGRALLMLKLHAATGQAAYLSKAKEYTDAMLNLLPKQRLVDAATGAVGFQWSHVGMLCVASVATSRTGNEKAAKHYAQAVADVFEAAADSRAGKYDDFDSGRAGLLYACRFLEANLPPQLVSSLFPRSSVLRLATSIVDRGSATGRAHGNDYLQWHGPNDGGLWLGQSHGSAGVLQMLLEVPELLTNATAAGWIQRTLDHTCDVQQSSGNFPTEYYNATQDWLVQWDHGAPGVSAALLRGWRAFGTPRYLASALKALDVVWQRGLLLKGLMNCHGIGGNVWMMLYASQQLAEAARDLEQDKQAAFYYREQADRQLYRALQFEHTVLSHPLLSDLKQMRQPQPLPDAPWLFWTGSVESAIELWTDLLYRGPGNASMTGWAAAL